MQKQNAQKHKNEKPTALHNYRMASNECLKEQN